jgi:hypothetical protein
MYDVALKIENLLKKQFDEDFITIDPDKKIIPQLSIINEKYTLLI